MRYIYAFLILNLVFSKALFSQKKSIEYPSITRSNQFNTYFGHTVPDPYRHLEERRSSTTQKWLKEQEELHDNYQAKAGNSLSIRNSIELRTRSEITLERGMGSYFFSFRFNNRSQAPTLYYRKKYQKNSKQLINPIVFDKSEKYITSIVDYTLSKDERFLAICITRSGSEWKEIRVIDMLSKKVLQDELKWIKLTSIAWMNNGFYYSRFETPPSGEEQTAINQNSRVMYHMLGTKQDDDKLIFEQRDLPLGIFDVQSINTNKLILYGAEFSDGRYLQNVYIKNSTRKEDTLRTIIQNPYSSSYSYQVIAEINKKLLVLTNRYSLEKKLYWYNVDTLNKSHLFDLNDEHIIRNAFYYNKKIIVHYSSNMMQQLCVYDTLGNELDRIYFNDGCNLNNFSGTSQDSIIHFYKNTYTQAPQLCLYNLNSFQFQFGKNSGSTKKRIEIVSELKYYPSKDGTLIPMTIIRRSDMKYNADQATLVYGYGGFGVPIEPFYDPGFIFFIQNGGVLAVPGIRGGAENGEAWHQAGRLFNKQNAIDDFAYAIKYLVKNRYTNTKKVIARGSSNGALIISACINKYPDLFSVAILEMGVYDMLRYDLFTTGYASVSEYGSSKNEKEFLYLFEYSPLHNIKPNQQYPSIYVITAENDDRVPSLHSYKYAATLQNLGNQENIVLLHTQKQAGHYGAQSYEDLTMNEAYIYSFIFKELGIKLKVE